MESSGSFTMRSTAIPNVDRIYGMFGYAQLLGLPAFIRIPEVNKTEVFRAMDMGAAGIVSQMWRA